MKGNSQLEFVDSKKIPKGKGLGEETVTTRTKQYEFLTRLTKFDQHLVCGPELTFSRMYSFGLTKAPFRRSRRYEFIDGWNVTI